MIRFDNGYCNFIQLALFCTNISILFPGLSVFKDFQGQIKFFNLVLF